MNGDKFFNIIGAIVGVAMVTTLVAHKETKNVIAASGNAFTSSLRVAMGGK